MSHIKVDRVADVLKAVRALTKDRVFVGVPAEEAPREGGGINNATIGYLNETGVPEQNLPARPHMLPGVEAVQSQIVGHMKAAAVTALDGNVTAIGKAQHKIGLIAQTSIQQKIGEGVPPALSPRTLYKRKHRKESPRQGETPLVDTGGYRNSIVYVIRRPSK